MRQLHREPFGAAVSVRHVRVRDHRLAGAYCKKAPLALGRQVVEQVDHRFETDSAEDADAGVAWSAAEVPDALVAEPLELAPRQLALRRPDLLRSRCGAQRRRSSDRGVAGTLLFRTAARGRLSIDACGRRTECRLRQGIDARPRLLCRMRHSTWAAVTPRLITTSKPRRKGEVGPPSRSRAHAESAVPVRT